jgi:hypothetical protein
MFSRAKRDANEGRLDEVGEALVGAARASDSDIESAAGEPLLYSRIRVSIAAGQRESGGLAGGWLSFLQAAKFAVPAMALVTVAVTCLPRLAVNFRHTELPAARVRYSRPSALPTQGPALTPSILSFAAGTCALSNTQECAISNNEVLATLFADDNQETPR